MPLIRKAHDRIVRGKVVRVRAARGKYPYQGPKFAASMAKGTLSSLGYKASDSDFARHKALVRAIAKYGALTVFRKLNAVMILTKRRSPETSDIFRANRNFVARRLKK